MENRNWLANFFDRQREIIESAETPASKLAIFVLPIIAPIVPATFTGIHLYTLIVTTFDLPGEEILAGILSILTSIVLELLGYVGAVSTVKSLYDVLRSGNKSLWIRVILDGTAYIFYLIALVTINYFLGKFLEEPSIVTTVITILSGVTIPTGLLAANYLNTKDIEEKSRKDRSERETADERKIRMEQEYKLERYKIKHGVSSGNSESSTSNGTNLESSKKVPDWRKLKSQLSREQLEDFANLTPDRMKELAKSSGWTYKTISNYRLRARAELGLSTEENGNG